MSEHAIRPLDMSDDETARAVLALQRAFPQRSIVVSTGRDNEPALALYRRRGFRAARDREAASGLWVTELERPGLP